MAKNKCPLCWLEAHADNPGNPEGYKVRIDYLPGKESEYKYEVYVMDTISGRSGVVESFKTREQAEHHIKTKVIPELEEMAKEREKGNPGDPDKVERYIKRRRLGQVAEELTDKDAVTDALWDLRTMILQALKEIGEITQETTGPEVQGTIDYLIRRLVFLV